MKARGMWSVIALAACGSTATPVEPAPVPATATVPAAAPAPAPAPVRKTESKTEQLDDDAQAMLDLHNKFRAEHCAPPLAWSDDLAAVAQKWADTLDARDCAFEHSRTHFGENLAAGTNQHLKPRTVVEMWYREVKQYDFRRAGFDFATGHFTQLVWLDTQRIGCGRTRCKTGMDLVVCNYDPPGNVEPMFRANVLPATCKEKSR